MRRRHHPVASRWPESSGVSPSSGPRLAAAEPPQNLQTQNPQTQGPQNESLPTRSPQTAATKAPQPAVAPVALAAADSSLERRSASMQMLLLVMAGALALAGITASLVFRFGRAQAIALEVRGDRRAIWDSIPTERSSPSMFPDEDTPIWRTQGSPQPSPRSARARRSGAAGNGNAGATGAQRADVSEAGVACVAVGFIFRAGAAGRGRTGSVRCGVRA